MYDTKTRVALVKKRSILMRKQYRSTKLISLSTLCCMLLALNVSTITLFSDTGGLYSTADWMFGTAILYSDAGGYVLVAVIAFVLAVMITAYSMKHHEKTKEKPKEKRKEDTQTSKEVTQ